MTRMFLFVGDDDPCPFRRDKDEIRMWHPEALAAIRADLVRLKRHCPIKFTDRLDQHHEARLMSAAVPRKLNTDGRFYWSRMTAPRFCLN